MKYIYKTILFAAMVATASACNFLDPLPNGEYTEENYSDSHTIMRGFIDKAYNLIPSTYLDDEYVGLDCASDDCIYTSRSDNMRRLSVGDGKSTAYELQKVWERDYQAIFSINYFFKDNIGPDHRYLIDDKYNAQLQKQLTGDAYALRAWFLYDLVKVFGGKDKEDNLLGVPIYTEYFEANQKAVDNVERASYDKCMEQIVSDCLKAIDCLPLANRDFLSVLDAGQLEGARRYGKFDQISVKALLANVYMTWASPAFNPGNDKSRWEKAASYAKEVMDHKLNKESTVAGGFNPVSALNWTNPNEPEIVLSSAYASGESYEKAFYPIGFGGEAKITPTQEFVDAFPDANGYPINRSSIYDASKPYENRDPRFYENVFYNGSQVRRNNSATDIMYTFNCAEGGNDAPGLVQTSLTGYYNKKYVYLGWNSYDNTIQKGNHSIFLLRWGQMCLIFAEAANHCLGPQDRGDFGLSAKEALSYIRGRSLPSGAKGVGATADPYLDECAAAGEAKFDELVKNEWRIETYLEGTRFFNLRRWGATAADLSKNLHGVKISADGKYSYETIETKKYDSPWLPLPYLEMRKSEKMVQNQGWENWN